MPEGKSRLAEVNRGGGLRLSPVRIALPSVYISSSACPSAGRRTDAELLRHQAAAFPFDMREGDGGGHSRPRPPQPDFAPDPASHAEGHGTCLQGLPSLRIGKV